MSRPRAGVEPAAPAGGSTPRAQHERDDLGDTYQVYLGSIEISSDAVYYGIRDSSRYSSGGFASVNVNGDDGYVTRSGSVLTLESGRAATTVTATLVGTSVHAMRDAVDYVYTQ